MSSSDQMRPWRSRAANIVPDLPPGGAVVYGPDLDPGGPDGQGTLQGGVEILQLRSDYPAAALDQATKDLMVENTSNHEAGHPEDARYTAAGRNHHALYWSFRGFPGTWDQAEADAAARDAAAPGSGWQFHPRESWAECFGIALSGRYTWALIQNDANKKEKTYDFGLGTPTPTAARKFFVELAGGVFMARFISDDLAVAFDANGNATVVTPIPASAGFIAGQKVACDSKRIGLAGTEPVLPLIMPAVFEDMTKAPNADGRFYIRSTVKGDSVHSGTGYLKVSAWQ
jgi:hypothetical protein